ncbi:Hypothetical predicted protein [Cloeon dipterum]|uniref:Ribonuclease H1 N-terminal domain-containing protein n=1 Tax=Cloeon dipterum TaxID=197152 RepID=A0A8S1CP45_9INSE|nr:Hypothetical predicted protein [Cloeon dipterum]
MIRLKIYAVGVGRKRGIFASRQECLKQTRGVSFSHYRSFSTLEDAEEYLDRYANVAIGTPNVNVSNSKFNQKMANNSAAEVKPVETRTTSSTKRTAAAAAAAEEGSSAQQSKKPKLRKFSKKRSSEKAEQPTKEELLKMNEEVERLRKKQSELKEEILKITQSVQETADSLYVLKEEISTLERYAEEMERDLNLSREISEPPNPKKHKTPSKAIRVKSYADHEDKNQCDCIEYDDDNYCKIYISGFINKNNPSSCLVGLGVFFGDDSKLNLSEPIYESMKYTINAQILAAVLACNVANLSNISKINIHTYCHAIYIFGTENNPAKHEGQHDWLDTRFKRQRCELLCLNEAKKNLDIKWTHVKGADAHGCRMAKQLAMKAANIIPWQNAE